MFEFAWPWMICLLPIPLLVWLLSPAPRGTGQSEAPEIYFPHIDRLRAAFTVRPGEKRRTDWLHHGLLALAWVGLVGALMQPQITDKTTQARTMGHDLMLAVDLSGSMQALDMGTSARRVNRVDAVKEVVERFVQARQGDRVGLVVFGQHAYLDVPLTYDTVSVGKMVENMVPGLAGDSTAIGDAIGVAVKNLRDRPGKSKVLILLTDGADNASTIPPMQAAKLAAQYGIRVYTICVGHDGAVPYPLPSGEIVWARFDTDEALLSDIADLTGGESFHAGDENALADIYQSINEMEKTEGQSPDVMLHTPLYRYPLGASLIFLLILAVLPVSRRVAHSL